MSEYDDRNCGNCKNYGEGYERGHDLGKRFGYHDGYSALIFLISDFMGILATHVNYNHPKESIEIIRQHLKKADADLTEIFKDKFKKEDPFSGDLGEKQ